MLGDDFLCYLWTSKADTALDWDAGGAVIRASSENELYDDFGGDDGFIDNGDDEAAVLEILRARRIADLNQIRSAWTNPDRFTVVRDLGPLRVLATAGDDTPSELGCALNRLPDGVLGAIGFFDAAGRP